MAREEGNPPTRDNFSPYEQTLSETVCGTSTICIFEKLIWMEIFLVGMCPSLCFLSREVAMQSGVSDQGHVATLGVLGIVRAIQSLIG